MQSLKCILLAGMSYPDEIFHGAASIITIPLAIAACPFICSFMAIYHCQCCCKREENN